MEGRRRPGWLFWLITVALVPVLYVLSSGPARYFMVVSHSIVPGALRSPSGDTTLSFSSLSLIVTDDSWKKIYGPLEMAAGTRLGSPIRMYWNLIPTRKVVGPPPRLASHYHPK